MNKKFLSAILFGALMVTSTGTFVSCKDYDEDIDSINKELTDIKSQLAALQTKVDAGKWITGVTTTANGVAITMSDGQTLNITNGKDGQNGAAGAQGEAGKDGKDGSVVEVKDGVLCINGVATEIKVAKEAPAALPCVKVEDGKLMVLGADGKYAATGIEAGAVTAAKTNGVWTITVDGQEIVVPGSAALTSIAIQEGENFVLNYSKLAAAKAWGWKQTDGTYDESMPAGFYTRLSGDVEVLLNPAEADGTAFTYTFKNSKGENAGVKFFGEARPSTKILTRAASGNGLWTLPAAITKFDAADINELRNELYLTFKQNDGKAYAMTLEAADGLGNVAVRSDYNYTVTLKQASGSASIADMKGLEIGKVYYPSIVGPVYDYKIRVAKGTSNERYAKAFGIEITEDGKGFSAANDAAVLNAIKFEYAYVTIAGAAASSTFSASFTDGMTASENLRAEALNAPFDAVLANTLTKNSEVSYAPAEIADHLENYIKYSDVYRSKEKVFVLKHKYDLTAQYAALSEDAKMLFDESINAATAELIGGEAGNLDDNYNAANRNGQLLNNIVVGGFDATKKQIEVRFYVSSNWKQPEAPSVLASLSDEAWDAYSNFQLNTAYQLNLSVPDAVTGEEVALIELPFEFTQPTLDIEQVDGEFTEWGTTPILRYTSAGVPYNSYERALIVYGVMGENDDDMFLPLYDSFDAWKAKDKANGITGEFQKYVDNAEYYELKYKAPADVRILSENAVTAGNTYQFVLEPENSSDKMYLDYSSKFENLNTFALKSVVTAAATNTTVKTWAEDGEAVARPYELSTPIEVRYKHYGVYLAGNTTEYDGNGNVVAYNGKVDNDDFHLVFASWLKHSEMEMAEESYDTERGKHYVYLTNDDLNFTTPKGDEFYLFDGIVNGKVEARADLNTSFNEVEQHWFTPVATLFTAGTNTDYFSAKAADGDHEKFDVEVFGEVDFMKWDADGDAYFNEANIVPSTSDVVKVYYQKGFDKNKTGDVTNEAIEPGLLVVLPTSITDGESIILTVTVKDHWGYKKPLEITINKLK